MAKTLLAVHAHPDDETITMGGTLARYSAEGVRTVVVTCTRGDLGEVRDPAPLTDSPSSPNPLGRMLAPEDVAALRDRELDRSGEIDTDHLVAAAFGSAGERCMAISATVAVGAAGDALMGPLTTKASAVRVGPGREQGSEMGPVVTREARDRIVGYIDSGERQGAKIRVDGRGLRVPGHENGFFVGPTVIDDVTTQMDVYRDEIFGPVLSVLRADTVDDAIRIVNANPYGNGTAIFTSSGEAARRFQRGVQVGMIGINVPIPVPMAYYSFGGWKESLFGDKHIHGPEGVSFYTRAKVVTARWPQRDQATGASYHFPTSN